MDSDRSWTRALAAAAAAPELEAALRAVFEAAPLPCGISAAAVVDASVPRRILATWQCEPADVDRRLGDAPLADGFPDGFAGGAPDDGRACCGLETAGVHAVPVMADGEPPVSVVFFADAGLDVGDVPGMETLVALVRLVVGRCVSADEARRARQTRDHFHVAIHHELRTPATALMLESGLLRSGLLGTLPPRLQASLTRLESRVGELVRVIQRVLDLAELESTGSAPGEDIVNPREAIVALARQVEPAATSRGIQLSLFFPRGLPVLQTDAERFRRVLLHLLGNAVKYSDGGSVQVRVERASDTGLDGHRCSMLVVRIVDSGRGIPPDELERVFEPFAQVEEGARTDSIQRGLGLGLSLARRLARSLGGEVIVESEVGRGTTASLLLPFEPPASH